MLAKLLQLIICVCSITAFAANAAEIHFGNSPAVVLEGPIVRGDCANLRNFIFDKGVGDHFSADLFLASPGGSELEAMEIGRLVRALKFQTIVPSVPDRSIDDALRRKAVNSLSRVCPGGLRWVILFSVYTGLTYLGPT
jgi:hypothetical protein